MNLIKFIPFKVRQNFRSYPLEIVVQLAAGDNIRRNYLNIPFTKKMAHLFSDHLDYVYVWLKSLGADDHFYELMRSNFPRGAFPNRNENIILHFERYTMFIKKLIFWYNKFNAFGTMRAGREIHNVSWLMGFVHHLIQDEPDFDLKGRTFASFVRLAEEYTEAQQIRQDLLYQRYQVWTGADYNKLEITIEEEEFKIVQLTTYSGLVEEGRVLSHCVGGYSGRCYLGDVSIWSLRRKVGNEEWKSEVTLEILKNRKIVQAKARFNSIPDDKYLNIIKDWAKREKLIFFRC